MHGIVWPRIWIYCRKEFEWRVLERLWVAMHVWVTCTWGRVEKNRVGNKRWSEGRCGLGDCNTRVFNDTSNSWSIKSCIKLLVKW